MTIPARRARVLAALSLLLILALVAACGGTTPSTAPSEAPRVTPSASAAAFPATLVDDVPAPFFFEGKEYIPQNYEDKYMGLVTLRKALTLSLNVATVKVAEAVGYDRVADMWSKKMKGPTMRRLAEGSARRTLKPSPRSRLAGTMSVSKAFMPAPYCMRARSTSEAPVASSMSATATSATTSAARIRVRGAPALPRPESFSTP